MNISCDGGEEKSLSLPFQGRPKKQTFYGQADRKEGFGGVSPLGPSKLPYSADLYCSLLILIFVFVSCIS